MNEAGNDLIPAIQYKINVFAKEQEVRDVTYNVTGVVTNPTADSFWTTPPTPNETGEGTPVQQLVTAETPYKALMKGDVTGGHHVLPRLNALETWQGTTNTALGNKINKGTTYSGISDVDGIMSTVDGKIDARKAVAPETPKQDAATAAIGLSNNFARADHVHPRLYNPTASGAYTVDLPSANDIHTAIGNAVSTHNTDATAHGATNVPTINTIIKRDSSGKAQVETPISTDDPKTIATVGYVNNRKATQTPSQVGTTANTGTSDKFALEDHVHKALFEADTAATGDKAVMRDSAGRAKVAAPTEDTDIALLSNVKTRVEISSTTPMLTTSQQIKNYIDAQTRAYKLGMTFTYASTTVPTATNYTTLYPNPINSGTTGMTPEIKDYIQTGCQATRIGFVEFDNSNRMIFKNNTPNTPANIIMVIYIVV